jgi:hypothetical protein
MTWFQSFTTKSFDSMCSAFGMNNIQLRHESTVISPTPIVEYNGPQTTGEANALDTQEYLESWTATIPEDTLLAVFGSRAAWESAIGHNQMWWTTYPGDTVWLPVRTVGDPKRDRASGRIEITLFGRGHDEPVF